MEYCMKTFTFYEMSISLSVKIEQSKHPTLNRKQGFRVNSVLKLRTSLTADKT